MLYVLSLSYKSHFRGLGFCGSDYITSRKSQLCDIIIKHKHNVKQDMEYENIEKRGK